MELYKVLKGIYEACYLFPDLPEEFQTTINKDSFFIYLTKTKNISNEITKEFIDLIFDEVRKTVKIFLFIKFIKHF